MLVAPFILACGACPACHSGHGNTCPNQRLPGFVEPGAFAEYVAVPYDHNLARLPDGALAHGGGGARLPGDDGVARADGARGASAGRVARGARHRRRRSFGAILGRAMGARVIVVDVVQEKLDHALGLGAEAAVNAREGGTAARIREITGGGAHVSVEALGIPETVNASIECLRPLGRHVQVGMPVGHTARMEINMNAVYMGNIALYGTRGMPAWKYPSLLGLIESGMVDMTPLIAREVALSDVSAELRAFNGPTPPGVAVVTDFTR